MEHIFKKFLTITALLSVVAAQANNVTPTLVYRSQAFHSDRQKLAGMVGHTHLYDMDSWYGTFDATVGYMRSFQESKIAYALFGSDLNCNDCSPSIKVQGSGVATRDAKAWLADYLYLNCSFDGEFTIKPQIQNVVVDLDFYLGLDEWVNGMYFRVWGPINWTKWQTNFCSTSEGLTTSCSAGYMTPSGTETLLPSITSYFAGNAPATVDGVTFQALRFAKMPNCDSTETGFADLRAELGWDFLQDDDYHLGVGIEMAAPTGNKREAAYVMNPVVGNGNHWELGGVVTGHYVFWRSEDEEKHFGFYMDANLMHLFKASEQRTFDLVDKDNSRYMLASKFTKTITGALRAADSATATSAAVSSAVVTPAYQFNNQYAPVANLTTANVDVSVGIQADITAMFNFTARGFAWDLGYNFYGRSCESIACATCPDSCNTDSLFNSANANTWALKGDARMFGYEIGVAGGPVDEAVALSATESLADIHGGTNAAQTTVNKLNNFGIDNARFAYANKTDGASPFNMLSSVPQDQGGLANPTFHVKTSYQPVLLSANDIAKQETRGISNTVFTHLSYTWDRDNWVPYLGIGGSAEFGSGTSCKSDCDTDCGTTDCDTDCGSCVNTALSQWAVWVKGGISFN
jgi:hypothetical protein